VTGDLWSGFLVTAWGRGPAPISAGCAPDAGTGEGGGWLPGLVEPELMGVHAWAHRHSWSDLIAILL